MNRKIMKINKMRKQFILFLLLVTAAGSAFAQTSTMTDDQVMSLVVREHEKGSSNAQIVTKLMQQGVDISQIRRVRDKYQRQLKQGGVTGTSAQLQGKETSRLRTNNGKTREDYGKVSAKNRRTTVTIASLHRRMISTNILSMRMMRSIWIFKTRWMVSSQILR